MGEETEDESETAGDGADEQEVEGSLAVIEKKNRNSRRSVICLGVPWP